MTDFNTIFVFLTLVIKGVTIIAVFLLIARLIYQNRKVKEKLLKYLILVLLLHEFAFIVGSWVSIRWFLPDLWTNSLSLDDFRVWASIIGLGLGSIGISYFSLNIYYTGRYEKVKKIIYNFNVILILLISSISTIFFLLKVSLFWVMLINSGSILITYLVSLLGWFQTRLNINEEDIEDYDDFIKRFRLIGFGTFSLLIGCIFYFADRFVENIDPALSIPILIGYIFIFLGIISFYLAFYKSNNKNK